MRAIMDALSPAHPARRVVFMKAAQVGATEAGNNWIGYVIHHAPGPMLAVQPTVELAKRFSRQRIEPLIAESPALRERVKPSRARATPATRCCRRSSRRDCWSSPAPTARWACAPCRRAICFSTRSMPIRRRPTRKAIRLRSPRRAREPSRGGRRCFWRRRRRSTASRGSSANTRRPTSAATSCRARIASTCSGSGSSGCAGTRASPRPHIMNARPATAAIEEHHKTAMLQAGEWRPTAEGADPGTIGFHLSALYSPVGWFSWADIARMWEAAQATDEAKRSFKNGVLGETWIETGEAPDWQRLYERREAWQIGTVPSGRAVPDRRRRRAEGPHRGRSSGPGAAASKAGSSITSSSTADPSKPRAGTSFSQLLEPDLAACARRAAWPCQARDRHRLRVARRLCLGPPGRSCAGRADQGRRGVQPRGAGDRARRMST